MRPFSRAMIVASACVALLAGLVVPAAQAADVAVGDQQFSLGLAPEETGTPGIKGAYIRMWDMGTAWRDINPRQGEWVWGVMDQRIAQIEQAGSKPLLVLGLTPQWAASSTAGDPRWGVGTAAPPTDANTYSEYVRQVMNRYGARIGAVEVWNEANLKTFWDGTAQQMAGLTNRANIIIKAISPNTLVLAASTTTRLAGSLKSFVAPYATELKNLDFPFDAWAVHSYPAANAGPAKRYADLKSWQDTVTTAAGTSALSKQIWDTEINYGLAGPGAIPDTDYTGEVATAYIARTFVDSIRFGIDVTAWYLWTASNYGLIGIQTFSGSPENNAAYSRARDWLSGSTFKGCDAPQGGILKCNFVKGSPFSLLMSNDDANVSYSVPSGATGQSWTGAPVVGGQTVTLGTGPVKFTTLNFNAPSVVKSIVITGARAQVSGKPGVKVSGVSTGLSAGTRLLPFVRFPGQTSYTQGANVPQVSADESFDWQRKTGKKVYVYFATEDGSVQSNRVIIPAAY